VRRSRLEAYFKLAPAPSYDRVMGTRALWSESSFLSVASRGSFLSIGSVGSALSIGSIGSFGSVFSVGSAGSVGSVLSARARSSVMSWGTKGAILGRSDHGRVAAAFAAALLGITAGLIAMRPGLPQRSRR
jgi:hypothetical protein